MREQGSAAIELAVGVLALLVPVAILVLSFGPTLEARVLARSLAIDAARVVAAGDGDVGPELAARLIRETLTAGVQSDMVRISVCGGLLRPLEHVGGCELDRTGGAEITVRIDVEPLLPGGPNAVSYTHVEPSDPYRSRR